MPGEKKGYHAVSSTAQLKRERERERERERGEGREGRESIEKVKQGNKRASSRTLEVNKVSPL